MIHDTTIEKTINFTFNDYDYECKVRINILVDDTMTKYGYDSILEEPKDTEFVGYEVLELIQIDEDGKETKLSEVPTEFNDIIFDKLDWENR